MARQAPMSAAQLLKTNACIQTVRSESPTSLFILLADQGRRRNEMGHSEYDPAFAERHAWNAGRKLGAKRALKPQQVWAIRFWLDRQRRLRDPRFHMNSAKSSTQNSQSAADPDRMT